MSRRVVITGLGMVGPLGVGVESSWEAAVAGKSGIALLEGFDTSQYKSRIAGQVKNFDPAQFIPPKQVKRLDPFCHFALAAGRMALEDSGLIIDEANADRVGVIIGCGLGGLNVIETQHRVILDRGPGRVSPFFIPMVCPNMAAGQVAMTFGAKGPNLALSTACAAGNHGIGEAFKTIQRGGADVCFAGGVESVISPSAMAGFSAMKALSTRNDDPERASRPFDAERDGFVIAEGGGILILEELEMAKARGARIYAEVSGYGLTADAHHMTAPSPGGEGAARCMKMALDDAGLNPDEIQYINAHGTSTGLNDAAETQGVKLVFGKHAYRLGVSSTKSMTGHGLGAAGGLEGVFLAKAIAEQVMPPTMNYENPDPDCDLDYVPNEARAAKIKAAMSNAFGFGGTNATVLFTRFNG